MSRELMPAGTPSIEASAVAALATWASEAAMPIETTGCDSHLAGISASVGSARIVAFGEAVHGAAQPLEFRNRLFRYLVEQKGFTAIALESGIVEGRLIHEYVRGAPTDPAQVLQRGFSWGFGRLPQNQELIRWMRAYNAAPQRARPINLYGFDVTGSPGNTRAVQGIDSALTQGLEYLRRVDAASASRLDARLCGVIENLKFDFHRPTEAPGYDRLNAEERDRLSAAIGDLNAILEGSQALFVARLGAQAYQWAHRAVLAARQADSWLRCIPIGWEPAYGPLRFASEHTAFLADANDVRDRAQADNMDWIVRQEGAQGRVLVFGHRYHLSAAPVRASWSGRTHQVMGTYLRRRYGKQLFTVGNLIGSGEVDHAGVAEELPPASAASLDRAAIELGESTRFADLGTAPDSLRKSLAEPHPIGHGLDVLELPLATAFDALLFMGKVTAAR